MCSATRPRRTYDTASDDDVVRRQSHEGDELFAGAQPCSESVPSPQCQDSQPASTRRADLNIIIA